MNFISILHIVDCQSGTSKELCRQEGIVESPNWGRDGRFIVVNSDGLLYRWDFGGDALKPIPTGFADQCNNDHGLSPDGRQLALSHHDESCDGESLIYTVPVAGGEPQLITPQGPSYWHSWCPDGETLAYVAGRSSHKDYKIYRYNLAQGTEQQLTTGPGLDDGPDYSADGQRIYFNSYRSGRMQIWRMNADGSDPQQVLHSECSDWFPHPCPRGEHLVFLRYRQDQGQAHPFGRDVQLMLLNLRSDELRELTPVFFGGQGSLNTPSWSPNGRRLAYIAYRAVDD